MTLQLLAEPLSHGFMWQALLLAVLTGVICAGLSCFLILKGWSLMGDAVSHAVFPGIVIAYVVGIPMAIGAFIAGFICAGTTGWIKANSRIKEDTIMGIVFTGMFALGLVIFTKIETSAHLNHILTGNLLGIEPQVRTQAIIVSTIVLIVLAITKRDLLIYCFDPNHARSVGLRVDFLHYLLLALLSATIVASLQAVGIILTIAMLIIPGATAYQLTDRFNWMIFFSTLSAVLSSVLGVYFSFFLDGSSGALIVLFQSAFFVMAMLFGPKFGIVWGRGLLLAEGPMAPRSKC
jgi:ABC-type Mn2+/Zn2+ transport system permease subunit